MTAHPPVSADSAAKFLSSKLAKVIAGTDELIKDDLAKLFTSKNGDIHSVVDTLHLNGLKFNWSSTSLTNDWRDWCDGQVTPQAASPISTALADMDILVEPPAPDYSKEASYLSELINTSRIFLHPGIDIPTLATTYRGQFPAMVRKMTISYNTAFPSHWTEKWLMEGYSRWLLPTPRNAATSLAPAPGNDNEPSAHQRMYPPKLSPRYTDWP